MAHESLLVVSAGAESIGKVIRHDGDERFLVESGKVFPEDFDFHFESNTWISEDGALLYTLTEYSEEEDAATGAPPQTGRHD